MNELENLLNKSPQFCLIFLMNSLYKIENNKESYIGIKWNKNFKSKHIDFSFNDFLSDFEQYLKDNKLDNILNLNNKYLYKFKDINKNDIKNEYLKYLNIAYENIESNNFYKQNKEKLIEDFLIALFAFRGSYGSLYVVDILRNDNYNEFLNYTALKIIEIAKKNDFDKYLNFMFSNHLTKKGYSRFWITSKYPFIKDSTNFFSKSKFKPLEKKLISYKENNFEERFIFVKSEYYKYNFDTNNKPRNSLSNLENIVVSEVNINNKVNIEIDETKNGDERRQYKKSNSRDQAAIKQMKELYFFENNNSDACESCGYSFLKDGLLERKYIEIHHIIQNSKKKIKGNYSSLEKVKKDFMFLCSNCHTLADRQNWKRNILEEIERNV